MHTLSYLVFGDRPAYQLELSYSVLSAVRYLRHRPADIRIVLVTEAGKHRHDLPLEHVHFTPDEFSAWRGDGRNVHRVKEFALMKVLDRYGGKVAHIDPDTYFLDHPAKLFERIDDDRTLMHENEGPLGQHRIWGGFLAAGPQEVAGYRIAADTPMFNSGVIGVTPRHRDLLLQAVALEDALFALEPIFNIEQVATGVVLSNQSSLSECRDLLMHYWGPERHFINAQCEFLFPYFDRERFERLVDLPELPRVGYPRIRLRDKLSSRLLIGTRAMDGDYRFAYLAMRSALALGARDKPMANAWARVALDGLRFTRSKGEEVRSWFAVGMKRDFDMFLPGRVERHGWMDSELRMAWMRFWADMQFKEASD